MAELPYECDLILKGGITSGVVYPSAIAEIAKDHRYRSIGGSSAGAIASVAAAAAEYGRQSRQNTAAFADLADIPTELAETRIVEGLEMTLLQRLFLPPQDLRPTLDLGLSIIRKRGSLKQHLLQGARIGNRHGKITEKLFAPGVIGVLMSVAVLVFAWSLLAVAFATLLLAVVAVVLSMVRILSGIATHVAGLSGELEQNNHGFVNGRPGPDNPGLTDWLHEKIQHLAGRTVDDSPLTFGELKEHQIELVTMTTNLSQNSPELFPFKDIAMWAFKREQLAALFPNSVVEACATAGEAAIVANSGRAKTLKEQELLPLPTTEDLPILIAARLSLSYPVVLSAIPLWLYQPVRNEDPASDEKWEMVYQQSWMSDGGIVSNMPIRLFDVPLPTRPTYGIDLGSGADLGVADEHNVWRPTNARQGRLANWQPIGSTLKLFGSVLTTMQNWQDNKTLRADGIRDRICKIRLTEDEGGLNLDMSPETIDGLKARGEAAGRNLAAIQRDPNQWRQHQWTRYRSMLAGLEDLTENSKDTYTVTGDYQTLSAEAYVPNHGLVNYASNWNKTKHERASTNLANLFDLDWGTVNNEPAPDGWIAPTMSTDNT